MNVHVPESRNQVFAAAVYDAHLAAFLDKADLGDGSDAAIFNHDRVLASQAAMPGIHHVNVGENQNVGRRLR